MRIYWIIILVLGLVVGLNWQFPEAIQTRDDKMHLIYMLSLMLLVGSGMLVQRTSVSDSIKYGAIWLVIILALVLVYYGFSALRH